MFFVGLIFCFIVVIATTKVYVDERHEPGILDKFKSVGRFGKSVVDRVVLLLRPSSSIAALFICENRTGLKNLVNLYAFGKLHSILEELFTSLLVTEDPQVTVHIKSLVWELSDYCRCSLYFNPLPKRELFIQYVLV